MSRRWAAAGHGGSEVGAVGCAAGPGRHRARREAEAHVGGRRYRVAGGQTQAGQAGARGTALVAAGLDVGVTAVAGELAAGEPVAMDPRRPAAAATAARWARVGGGVPVWRVAPMATRGGAAVVGAGRTVRSPGHEERVRERLGGAMEMPRRDSRAPGTGVAVKTRVAEAHACLVVGGAHGCQGTAGRGAVALGAGDVI